MKKVKYSHHFSYNHIYISSRGNSYGLHGQAVDVESRAREIF